MPLDEVQTKTLVDHIFAHPDFWGEVFHPSFTKSSNAKASANGDQRTVYTNQVTRFNKRIYTAALKHFERGIDAAALEGQEGLLGYALSAKMRRAFKAIDDGKNKEQQEILENIRSLVQDMIIHQADGKYQFQATESVRRKLAVLLKSITPPPELFTNLNELEKYLKAFENQKWQKIVPSLPHIGIASATRKVPTGTGTVPYQHMPLEYSSDPDTRRKELLNLYKLLRIAANQEKIQIDAIAYRRWRDEFVKNADIIGVLEQINMLQDILLQTMSYNRVQHFKEDLDQLLKESLEVYRKALVFKTAKLLAIKVNNKDIESYDDLKKLNVEDNRKIQQAIANMAAYYILRLPAEKRNVFKDFVKRKDRWVFSKASDRILFESGARFYEHGALVITYDVNGQEKTASFSGVAINATQKAATPEFKQTAESFGMAQPIVTTKANLANVLGIKKEDVFSIVRISFEYPKIDNNIQKLRDIAEEIDAYVAKNSSVIFAKADSATLLERLDLCFTYTKQFIDAKQTINDMLRTATGLSIAEHDINRIYDMDLSQHLAAVFLLSIKEIIGHGGNNSNMTAQVAELREALTAPESKQTWETMLAQVSNPENPEESKSPEFSELHKILRLLQTHLVASEGVTATSHQHNHP